MLEFLFWLFTAPAALAALASIHSGRKYLDYVEAEMREEVGGYAPPATLIVPVKGIDHDLPRNLRSLLEQDYPGFELIVVARVSSDEGLRVAQTLLGPRVRFVTAGEPPDGTGEKIHNLLAAVAAARDDSEVFAFADSDGQVRPDWLRRLVAPLEDAELGATTAFRWYFPEEGGFWPLLRSAWDSAIAGSMRADDKNFAWGGGMALRRTTFAEARVERYWRGTVSDDYRLAAALKDAGRGIRFVPGAMVATTGSCSRDEFLDWAKRQLVITRAYRGGLWLAGFAAHIVYCGAMVMGLAYLLSGNLLGLGGLIVTTVPGMGKGTVRALAARRMFPDREDWLDHHSWIYFWYTPLATWVWLWTFLRSATTRTIHWRGNVYELLSAEQTRTLKG